MTNICVLRSGGDFTLEHVRRLSSQVPDLVCLSDVYIEGIKTIPLLYNWPKWWAKLELFRPDIKGDLFYFDLDTLVLKMPKTPTNDTVLEDFGDKSVIGSGLMYLTEEKRGEVWREFTKDPKKAMQSHVKWPAGDQGFLLPFYRDAGRWQRIAKVYSYKIDCKKCIPIDAEVVCFHGKPRPWELGL